MRQPGTEFNVDPYKAFSMEGVPVPELSSDLQKKHHKWSQNALIFKAHKFCGALCMNFKSGKEVSNDEGACMNTCLSKYNQAYESYLQEKQIFFSALDDVMARGQDKYDARNI